MSEDTYGWDDGLATISEKGRVPHTRMQNARSASNRIQQLLHADRAGRARRRALVKGLVDGNAPYQPCDLRKAGRAYQCNVNWRVAEFYLNSARSAFYDVFSEAPTYATITLNYGSINQSQEYSGIVTEEFDRLLRHDPTWDYVNQISQYEMILYGSGPLLFPDGSDWHNDEVLCRNLLVPEFSKSNPEMWEEAAVIAEMLPHKLYEKIVDEKIARQLGWNVEAVRKAIMQAHPKWSEGGQYQTWEWHQQMLKNESYHYSAESRSVSIAHYFFREFPQDGQMKGRITHCIVINPDMEEAPDGYLFRRWGRFGSWSQIVHPMYYDNDGGGYHHSVTGLGVKMYSAMEYQNRLLCNMADKVFAPRVLFKPTSAQANEALNIVQWGDYGKVPHNLDVVQTPVGSYIEDGMGFNREVTGMIASNLSQYRQNLSREGGNPITATEAQYRASEQARLGKTQLNHYYRQSDALYYEKYRRAANQNLNPKLPGAKLALAFQQRCVDRGVPKGAMVRVEQVIATRIIGQGSQFMRQQSLEKLMAVSGMVQNDAGRKHMLDDFIASHAGQALVKRYNPPIEVASTDQEAFAMVQVASAKNGIPPVVTDNQDHVRFASIFLTAASQSIASLEDVAGTPMLAQLGQQVLQFIELLGPAIAKHIAAAKANPQLARLVKDLEAQWQQLGAVHDKLAGELQKQQQEQAQSRQELAAMQNGGDPDQQLQMAKLQADNRRKDIKLQSDMGRKNLQARQKLAIADATAATKIRNERTRMENATNGE